MRTFLTAFLVICLGVFGFSAQVTAQSSCDSLLISETDTALVLPFSGGPGDTVWAPVYLKTDSAMLGFIMLIRYDTTLLTPLPDPADPFHIQSETVGRFSEAENFLVSHTAWSLDSASIVASFGQPLDGDNVIDPGAGVIFRIPFVVNWWGSLGDSSTFWFHQADIIIFDTTITGPDTLIDSNYVACRKTHLALTYNDTGDVVDVWPTTPSSTFHVDTSGGNPTIYAFMAQPTSIIQGDSTWLFWVTSGIDSVTIDHGVGAFETPSGSVPVSPDTTTNYTLTAYGQDTSMQASVTVNVTLPGENQYPVLDPISDNTSPYDQPLSFQVTASDPDGDIPSLSTSPLPGTATFTDYGDGAGFFYWSRDESDIGVHVVTFYATDGIDSTLVDSIQATFTVLDGNFPPEATLEYLTPDSVFEGDTVQVLIHATDEDSGPPSLEARLRFDDTLATNMVFIDSGNGAGLLTFTPDGFQGNGNPTYYRVSYTIRDADDPTLTVSTHANIWVFNENLGVSVPELSFSFGTGPFTTAENDSLVFVVTASTSDGDLPDISTGPLPNNAWMSYPLGPQHPEQRKFRFYPNYEQAGEYAVTFYATNVSLVDSATVSITVNETNQLPVIFFHPLQQDTLSEEDTLNFAVSAADPDSTIPLLSSVLDGQDTLATNMSFADSGNGVGVLTFIPNRVQGSSPPSPRFYYLRFIAHDAVYTEEFKISATKTIRVYDNGLPCCIGDRGDVDYGDNGAGLPNIADLARLVDYLYRSHIPLPCVDEANIDGADLLDLADVTVLVAYLFEHGSAMPPCQ